MQVSDGWVDRWMDMDRAELWGTLALPYLMFPGAPSPAGCPSSPGTAGELQQRHIWEVTGDGQSHFLTAASGKAGDWGWHSPTRASCTPFTPDPRLLFPLLTPKFMSLCVCSHTHRKTPKLFVLDFQALK